MSSDGRTATALFLAVLALVTVLAWPVLIAPATMVVGGIDGDASSVAWTLWWVAQWAPALPPAQTDLLMAPAGVSLLPTGLAEAWLLSPLTRWLGPLATLNLLQLLHPALAVGAAWLLLRDQVLTGAQLSAPAAAVGAASFGLGAVLTTAVANGNVDASPLFIIPLAAWAARRAHRGWLWAVGAGLCIGAAPWLSPYAALCAALLVLLTLRRPGTGVEGARLGVAGLLGVGLALTYGRLVTTSLGAADAMVNKSGAGARGAVAHLSGFMVAPDGGIGPAGLVHGWHLGWVVLGLGAMGAGAGWALRHRGPVVRWAVVALAGLVLSLGPVLYLADPAGTAVGGPAPGWRLPWAALFELPGLAQLHLRHRFAVLSALGMGALAAMGVQALATRSATPRWVGLGAAAVVLAELLVMGGGASHFRAHLAPEDAACGLLADLPPGSVADLPLATDARWLHAQTCHGRPVVSGINRSATRPVQQALAGKPTRSARRLADLGIAYVVVHTQLDADDPGISDQERARTAAWAQEAAVGRLRVVAEDGGVIVVATGQD